MDKEQLEKLTIDYQKLQSQLQALAMQKEQFLLQKEEFKEAAEQIEKATGKVYSAKGGAIIETTKEEATKNIKERQESADMRLGIVTKQYDEAIKKEKTLREEINSIIKTQQQQ
jgi:chaperonin cofactor prefoldin